MRRLYRAAEDGAASPLASFSPDFDVALAYTNNRGFGGPLIYRYDVSDAKLLDLYRYGQKDWRKLAEVVAEFRGADPPHARVYVYTEATRRKVSPPRRFCLNRCRWL